MYDLTVALFIIMILTWLCQQYIPIPLNIMGYRNEMVCYIVVMSVQILSYPVRRQIKIQQTFFQQYIFKTILMSHILLCTDEAHTTHEQHVHCVTQRLDLTEIEKLHKKITCVTTNINNIIS